MKKLIIYTMLLICIVALFAGCKSNGSFADDVTSDNQANSNEMEDDVTSENQAISNELKVGIFSYEEDCEYYKESIARYGWFDLDFVNVQSKANLTVNDIVDMAKNEVVGEYDTIDVYYDSQADIYLVHFHISEACGGDTSIYITSDGITQLLILGE